jgi:hypothetical protein
LSLYPTLASSGPKTSCRDITLAHVHTLLLVCRRFPILSRRRRRVPLCPPQSTSLCIDQRHHTLLATGMSETTWTHVAKGFRAQRAFAPFWTICPSTSDAHVHPLCDSWHRSSFRLGGDNGWSFLLLLPLLLFWLAGRFFLRSSGFSGRRGGGSSTRGRLIAGLRR